MCIPIDLDVPVLAMDGVEVGTAREILCACAHQDDQGMNGHAEVAPTPIHRAAPSEDLWLRATRPLGLDLYIPFGEIAETRADGVRLRVTAEAAERRGWDDVPADLPARRAVAG